MNNDKVITGSDDGKVRIYDINLSKMIFEIELHQDFIRDIIVINKINNTVILTCGDDGSVNICRFINNKIEIKKKFDEAHADFVMKLSNNPKDDKMFASCGMDCIIKIYNLESETFYTLPKCNAGQCSIEFSGKNISDPILISGGDDLNIYIFD